MDITSQSSKRNDLLLAAGAFVIALVMWQFSSPIVYPLRLFVTFIHELGHGIAAIGTGGEFLNFEVKDSGAGLAYSRGGYRPVIAAAGYVGTAIFGATLLYVANTGQRDKRPKRVALILGVCFTLLTLIYSGLGLSNFNIIELSISAALLLAAAYLFLVRRSEGRNEQLATLGLLAAAVLLTIYFAAGDRMLTVTVGVLSGILLILCGMYARRDVNLFVLNFLAFAVGLNAITDAWVLLQIVTTSDRVPNNDATSMANVTIFPAWFWAGAWIGLAIVLMGLAIWMTFIRPLRKL